MGHDYYLYGRKMYLTFNFGYLSRILFTMRDFHGEKGSQIVKMITYNCRLMEKYWGIRETPIDKTNPSYWWGVKSPGKSMNLLDQLKVYYNYMKLLMRIINEYNGFDLETGYVESHIYKFSISSDQSYGTNSNDFEKNLVQKVKNNMLLSCQMDMLLPDIKQEILNFDDILKSFKGTNLIQNPSTCISHADVFLESEKHLYGILLPAPPQEENEPPQEEPAPPQKSSHKKLTKYKYYLKFIQKNKKL